MKNFYFPSIKSIVYKKNPNNVRVFARYSSIEVCSKEALGLD